MEMMNEEVKKLLEKWHKEAKKIVLTNGCFDILHVGHVRYLNEAKKLGDILIVGLNSDFSVKQLKGNNRPINNENDRKEVLEALRAVDLVIIFNEMTAVSLVEVIEPDIYAKGGDYTFKELPESKFVEKNGGKVVLLPQVFGKSTTNTINSMKRCNEA